MSIPLGRPPVFLVLGYPQKAKCRKPRLSRWSAPSRAMAALSVKTQMLAGTTSSRPRSRPRAHPARGRFWPHARRRESTRTRFYHFIKSCYLLISREGDDLAFERTETSASQRLKQFELYRSRIFLRVQQKLLSI